MIICRTFNFEFSSYNLLSYRRRQIDLLWKGQRHKMSGVDVTECKHYTTHFWRRKKKLNLGPLCMQCRCTSLKNWMGGIQKLTLGVYSGIKQCLNTNVCVLCILVGGGSCRSIKQFILLYIWEGLQSPTEIFLSYVCSGDISRPILFVKKIREICFLYIYKSAIIILRIWSWNLYF